MADMRLVRQFDVLQFCHGLRDQPGADCRCRGDLQDPALTGRNHLCPRGKFGEGHQQTPRLLLESYTLFRKLHATAHTVKQLEAELSLEILNGAGYRRLGTPEHLSSLSDATAGSNGKEGLEIAS